MFDRIGQFFGGLTGRRSTLSVPILDGAFKPNNLLEEAEVVLQAPGLEDMALAPDGQLHLAVGPEWRVLDSAGAAGTLMRHDAAITAICLLPDGRKVAALGNRIVIEGRDTPITGPAGWALTAVTALSPMRDGRILVCDASARHDCGQWQHDLMTRSAGGRLLALDPATGKAELLQGGLGWANGAADLAQGVLVSESWRHRLRWPGRGDATAELPGYPARITPTTDGGFWLSLFSGRAQIVEFVLNEHAYRREMMETIAPEYWISPALCSGQDFLEPLQSGGVKNMGILKPWAPPRSHGLAVRFDAQRIPRMSIHSRVGGRNHGIVTTLERGTEVFSLSKGAGRLLRLDLTGIRAAHDMEETR